MSGWEKIRRVGGFFRDWFFPERCILCLAKLGEDEKAICQNCFEEDPFLLKNFCEKCGKPLYENEIYCYDCKRESHVFEKGHALFLYTERKDLIRAIKYDRQNWRLCGVADLMDWLFSEEVAAWGIEAVAYVPQSFRQIGEKGYNPPQELAKMLAERWHLPLITALKATRKKKHQKDLDAEARKQNLKNVFHCKEMLPYSKVLLIDDVYTTGATMDACALRLREKGVDKVYFLTIAIGSETGGKLWM